MHALLIPALYNRPRPRLAAEMEVAIPRFAQVVMAAGDRYLAADVAGVRVLVAGTELMDAENYRILGLVQQDISWLNPAHEDNYYLAAAILPWNGEVDAAQAILKAASEARRFDWQPAFYYAFNALHFWKNSRLGAEWLRVAATQASEDTERIQLMEMAAQWADRGEDRDFAVRLHRAMAKETRDRNFAVFLEKRARRLENLLALDQAIQRYRELAGAAPARLGQLVEASVMPALPRDPFSMDYAIGPDGKAHVIMAASSVRGSVQ